MLKSYGVGGGGGWVVLDYNVSSGPFLSSEIEIGDGPGPELDNFQEVWCPEDYQTICSLVRNVLPYSHFFDHGIIGSGTCILSKAPIRDAVFHEFSLNGYPHKIFHGDWFAGKGIGVCNIDYKVLY